MKKIIIICVTILVLALSVGAFFVLKNIDKKQDNLQTDGVQDKTKDFDESAEDEKEKSELQDDTKDKELNESKDEIIVERDGMEEDVKIESNIIISTPSTVYENTKPNVSVEIDTGQEEEVEKDEFRDDFVEWEDMSDLDNDGLPDSYETDIGTDIYNADTDGDGLMDGYEELYSITNPLNKYSLEGGIIDAELDLDNDGLSVLEEFECNTDPLEADTDYDGLNDGEEIKVYGTLPMVYDTDADTLCDGAEIIIGLDPLKQCTYGYDDKDYSYGIDVKSDSDILYQVNHDNDEYQLSLTLEGKGQAMTTLSVRESAYSDIITEEYVLGVIPEIRCEKESDVSSIILQFKINKKDIDNENELSTFSGLNKYNIFKYDEEEKSIYPINTSVNESSNSISALVDELGTYCIIDMEKWLVGLGFELVDAGEQNYKMENPDEGSTLLLNTDSDIFSVAKNNTEIVSIEENMEEMVMLSEFSEMKNVPEKSIDVAFCYNNYIEKFSEQQFTVIKDNIVLISEYLFAGSENVRIYIIDQYGKTISASKEQAYASDIYQVKEIVNRISNEKYSSGRLDVQINEIINSVGLRDDSVKIGVFIGDAYCSNVEWIYNNIINYNIQCIAVTPRAEKGGFYDKLAMDTDGTLLYNYIDFTKELVKHIYGYVPFMPSIPYTVVSSAGLRTISLDDEIRKDSVTNSDTDDLTDWEEIDQNKIIVNEDGSITLQNYWDYLQKYFSKKVMYSRWTDRYHNLYNKDGKTLEEMLSEIYVLPIISDPTKEDSDGDGIKDDKEVVWDGIDERYKGIDPLHEDTIETLFPELTEKDYNNRANATYISVDGNDVVLHVKAYFTGDAETEVNQYLKTTGLSQGCQDEVDNIKSRLGEDFTFKELIIDGVQSRWSGVYRGSSYDFCPGLKVNFTIDFVEDDNPEIGERSIEVSVKNGVCGYSNCVNRFGWKTNSIRIIQVYTSYCENSSHKNRIFKDCYDYAINQYDIAQYGGAIAHEFGHAFGLADMYDEADYNKGYEPVSNDELKYDKIYSFIPSGKGIMMISGKAVTNDIEMILIAFCENKKQFYVPQGTSQKVSKAIKSEVSYVHNLNSGNIYQWNQTTHSFQIR